MKSRKKLSGNGIPLPHNKKDGITFYITFQKPEQMIKKQIPNIITLSNLSCGAIAIYFAAQGSLITASLFVILGAVFDFFDGMTARLLKVQSPVGKELDSLADDVTFGVAPGFIAFRVLGDVATGNIFWLKFLAILIPAFSAYRLAKFNLDERQTTSFIGLATPANALVWLSIGTMHELFMKHDTGSWLWSVGGVRVWQNIGPTVENPWFLSALVVVLCIALVCELPLFSLKFKNLRWNDNYPRFVFLILSAIMMLLMGIVAIPFVMMLYIFISICYPPTDGKKNTGNDAE